VRSVYLSLGRFEGELERDRYAAELTETAATLKTGGAVAFIPSELERLSKQLRVVRSVTPRMAWGAIGRLFLPAAVFIVALVTIAWFLRSR
jgi:hypothetical protein